MEKSPNSVENGQKNSDQRPAGAVLGGIAIRELIAREVVPISVPYDDTESTVSPVTIRKPNKFMWELPA